ncbi:hypothetical protein ACFL3S_00735 [Gemmatimonadota bacterium]
MSIQKRMAPILLSLLLVLWGCATGGGDGSPRRNRNLITADELEAYQQLSAFDAIQQLRPRWLMADRAVNVSGSGHQYPKVVLDGIPQGELDALRMISVPHILEIRFLNSADATTRYGTGYVAGAIEVKTRGGE